METPDAIPRIIDNDTWEKTQKRIALNSKRTGRYAVKGEEYLLTGKLFCKHCGSMMTGTGGTSKTGKAHKYYRCKGSNKEVSCTRKRIPKQKLEDKVVNDVVGILNDDIINKIAKQILEFSLKESNSESVQYLKKQIAEKDKVIKNLLEALEQGQLVSMISEQITLRQEEKKI